MWFFTADEHYGHTNILQYCNRPFSNIDEMNEALIRNHNEVVGRDDTTVHIGDFSLIQNRGRVEAIISRLNGKHIFIRGSHDYWLSRPGILFNYGPDLQIWEKSLTLGDDHFYIVACHYALRAWPREFHGSWQLYGHSHGTLPPEGKQMDVGVDTHDFYPYSLEDIAKKVRKLPAKPGRRAHEKKTKQLLDKKEHLR